MVFVQVSALRDSAAAVNQVSGKQRFCRCSHRVATLNGDQIGKDRFRSHPMPQPRRLGYIRVSTRAQAPDRQIDVLRAECDALYIEHVSAVAAERPVFDRLITDLRPGDTFVVVDLDRAFRSAVDATERRARLGSVSPTSNNPPASRPLARGAGSILRGMRRTKGA